MRGLSILFYLSIGLNIVFCVLATIWLARKLLVEPVDHEQLTYRSRLSVLSALPPSPTDILFAGDSLIDRGEWAELFAGWQVKNRGSGFETSAGLLARLDELIVLRPKVVVLFVGGNDLLRGVSIGDATRDYTEIVQTLRTELPSAQVIITAQVTPNRALFSGSLTTAQIEQWNAQLSEIAKQFNAHFFDLNRLLADSTGGIDPQYSYDGIHLNGAGYRIWRDALQSLIRDSESR